MKKTKKPFFAKFLEKQITKNNQEEAKGGLGQTNKYPSDKDDYDVTMKYPSDGDEGVEF